MSNIPSTLTPLIDHPNIGDEVFELDRHNKPLAKFKVNENYKRDSYPELITVKTIFHKEGWFQPGEDTIKCKEQLVILRA